MSDHHFALATFALASGKPMAALVLGAYALEVAPAHAAYLASSLSGGGSLSATGSVLDLLEDWDRNFAVLQAMADFAMQEGLESETLRAAAHPLDGLRPLPPVLRSSKILNCAANYSGHLAEMSKYTQSGGHVDPASVYKGDKRSAQPYLFLKAPSCLIGAYDDIVMPSLESQVDWEAELGVVIGSRCKAVSPERAIEHVAGFITFNDISCRDQLFRTDRPNFRTDWFSSKSYDTFGPAGPLLVPRAFVPNHGALRLTLKLNGEVKQDGVAGDMIFSPEEQIAYASTRTTLEPGDLFATGTLAGVGQSSGTFLKPGDIVETEVQGLGVQRNQVIAPQ